MYMYTYTYVCYMYISICIYIHTHVHIDVYICITMCVRVRALKGLPKHNITTLGRMYILRSYMEPALGAVYMYVSKYKCTSNLHES